MVTAMARSSWKSMVMSTSEWSPASRRLMTSVRSRGCRHRRTRTRASRATAPTRGSVRRPPRVPASCTACSVSVLAATRRVPGRRGGALPGPRRGAGDQSLLWLSLDCEEEVEPPELVWVTFVVLEFVAVAAPEVIDDVALPVLDDVDELVALPPTLPEVLPSP